jgi:hypothetical protein
MKKFLVLLRKDWRMNRAPVVALAVVTVVPYLVACWYYGHYTWELHVYHDPARLQNRKTMQEILRDFKVYRDPARFLGLPLKEPSAPEPVFLKYLPACAKLGLVISVIMAAAFGGAAFAIERRERSADFLAMTPAARWQIILSKLVISIGCLAPVWAIHQAVLASAESDTFLRQQWLGVDVYIFAALCVATFGLSFFLSIFLESAAIAACATIGIVVAMCLLIGSFFDQTNNVTMLHIALVPCAVGLAAAISGAVYYSQRVAP